MKYGLIGEKLTHSFSVLIHSYIGDYDYELKELKTNEVEEFLLKKDFSAVNVTIPYKKTVMPFLDYIDATAEEIGAVNTIVNKNGKLYGYNTDYYGLTKLLTKNFSEFSGKNALILGTGGTSKTAYKVLCDLGVKSVTKVSRTPEIGEIGYDEAYKTNAEILINTTPCGMFPNSDGAAVDLNKFHGLELVIDTIYNPLRTDLILAAQSKNIQCDNGLYMLVCQAIRASELFFDTKYDSDIADNIYKKILQKQQNIVLTGMPGSGKSTIGAMLASKLNKPFFDTDALIIERIKMSISDFFNKYGEAEFRKTESQVIKEISGKNGCIIATGGGAVLNPENIRRLKHNGVICFLNRDLSELLPTADRPLASNSADIKRLYSERIDLYGSCCDFSVKVTEPEETSDSIIKELEK